MTSNPQTISPSDALPSAGVRSKFAVSVLLERRLVSRGRWTQPQWEALAAVVGERAAEDAAEAPAVRLSSTVTRRPKMTVVLEDGERRQCLWSGLEVALYKDGCEGYWYNLLSEQPRLFIVCFDDEENPSADVEPVIVTPNQDEANAHMESDDPVFSVPMPEQAHAWVEQFVIANYTPEIKKKRKRRDWTAESQFGRDHRKRPPDA